MKTKLIHAAKWALTNFECGMCDTGVVQVHQVIKRGGILTTNVNGCLDCGHEYGLKQASALKLYTRNDVTWA